MDNMVYVVNRNFFPAVKGTLAALESALMRFLVLSVAFLGAFLILRRPLQDVLALSGILSLIGTVFYFVPFFRRISRIKKVVQSLEIGNGQIILDTIHIRLLGGLFASSGSCASGEIDNIEIKPIKNDVILLPYQTEVFCVSINGRQYYLVATFFDDYENIKSSLHDAKAF
jgi:hypothetical protein